MTNTKSISVIMPVYNETLHELADSISSIQNQTYKNFEFIIVDDNPKSNNIRTYLLNKQTQDNRIHLIFNKQNLGAMKSANIALKHSNGKFIARMDADDIARKDRLIKQLMFCERYNLDFVCCNYYNFNHDLINHQLNSVLPNVTQVNQHKIRRVMSYLNIAVGPTLFFKRNIIKRVGLYRNILCEDYDLAIRTLSNGYKMGYLSDTLIYKRNRNDNISGSNTLEEFVVNDSISRYVRKYKFHNVCPLTYIKNCLRQINQRDKYNYSTFVKYSKQYKKYRHISDLIMKYSYGLSSFLVSKRNIISHFAKKLQTILLK